MTAYSSTPNDVRCKTLGKFLAIAEFARDRVIPEAQLLESLVRILGEYESDMKELAEE